MGKKEIVSLLLNNLWDQYRRSVPYAQRYAELVEAAGGRVVNDHIALRSFNLDLPMQPAGIEATRTIFEACGYTERGCYDFPDAPLSAVHLEHEQPDMPRVFISQLEVSQLPQAVVDMIRLAVSRTAESWAYPADVIDDIRSGKLTREHAAATAERLSAYFNRPWSPPPRAIIGPVNEASQYAAWTLLHGNAINHFTASINNQAVEAWADIDATADGLRAAGVPMKDTIEGAPGSKLRQSSTRAAQGEFEVTEDDGQVGMIPWTYAYYELAERGYETLPDGSKMMFSGFLGSQTPALFDMTRLT